MRARGIIVLRNDALRRGPAAAVVVVVVRAHPRVMAHARDRRDESSDDPPVVVVVVIIVIVVLPPSPSCSRWRVAPLTPPPPPLCPSPTLPPYTPHPRSSARMLIVISTAPSPTLRIGVSILPPCCPQTVRMAGGDNRARAGRGESSTRPNVEFYRGKIGVKMPFSPQKRAGFAPKILGVGSG